MKRDEREPVESLLRRLPRDRAGETFVTRLEARLDQGRRRTPRRGLRPAALLAAVLVGLAVGVAAFYERHPSREAQHLAGDEQRLRDLRLEYESLQRELDDLRLLAAESQPLIGVAGDSQYDYLLDLRDLLADSAGGQVRPVNLRD